MSPSSHRRSAPLNAIVACLLALALLPLSTPAYPPAPHHTLYGMVRNQWGDPVNLHPSDVVLETSSGDLLRSSLVDGLEPGVNYRLQVPMDSGTAPDLYRPTALRPFHPFRLRVRIGQSIYLPIEMAGDASQIGAPGQATRLDLTLGIDTDGDGLPDAWEEALIALLGGSLADIHPGDDTDGDGISNLDEYLAGTYAFDPTDGFRLEFAAVQDGVATLEFLAIRGRSYRIEATTNLVEWAPVTFRVMSGGVPGTPQAHYQADDVRLLRVEVPMAPDAQSPRYFRALVQ